jgi:hypothetical protein
MSVWLFDHDDLVRLLGQRICIPVHQHYVSGCDLRGYARLKKRYSLSPKRIANFDGALKMQYSLRHNSGVGCQDISICRTRFS